MSQGYPNFYPFMGAPRLRNVLPLMKVRICTVSCIAHAQGRCNGFEAVNESSK